MGSGLYSDDFFWRGSHNTMTYLRPKNILGWIARPWSKCQGKSLNYQYYIRDIQVIDIRVRFWKGHWVLSHGWARYSDNEDILYILRNFAISRDIALRILVEGNPGEDALRELGKILDDPEMKLGYFPVRLKRDWDRVLFQGTLPEVLFYQPVSSMDRHWFWVPVRIYHWFFQRFGVKRDKFSIDSKYKGVLEDFI